MTRPTLAIIDPVKPPAQTYAGPVMLAASNRYDLTFLNRTDLGSALDVAAASDAIWVDWGVDIAVTLSRWNERHQKPLFIRLHAFELLEGRSVPDIAWSNVAAVVCVSEEIATLLRQAVATIDAMTNVCIIPNGVCATKFAPDPLFDPFQLAWVGVLSPKKNPFFAIHVLSALVETDTRYQLSMAGEAESPRTVRHLHFLIEKLELWDHVTLNGFVTDMPNWYRNKGVLLSTSLYESFGLAIAEAAMAGLRPVVFDFPNASSLWPASMLVKTIPEAVAAIRSARQSEFRAFVEERYPVSGQISAIAHVLDTR